MDAVMTKAPCGCERYTSVDGAWVAHSESCRATQARENARARAVDRKAHLAKQEAMTVLAGFSAEELTALRQLLAKEQK